MSFQIIKCFNSNPQREKFINKDLKPHSSECLLTVSENKFCGLFLTANPNNLCLNVLHANVNHVIMIN